MVPQGPAAGLVGVSGPSLQLVLLSHAQELLHGKVREAPAALAAQGQGGHGAQRAASAGGQVDAREVRREGAEGRVDAGEPARRVQAAEPAQAEAQGHPGGGIHAGARLNADARVDDVQQRALDRHMQAQFPARMDEEQLGGGPLECKMAPPQDADDDVAKRAPGVFTAVIRNNQAVEQRRALRKRPVIDASSCQQAQQPGLHQMNKLVPAAMLIEGSDDARP
mmetsp:Transcript_58811/g.177784  ORF Transcript_58811/g.177784 Transcript_58811/m.177784 type:complete len:223 (+) Transcript_58811:37-705(+)